MYFLKTWNKKCAYLVDCLLLLLLLLRSVIFMTVMNLLKWTVEESRLQTFCDTLDNNYA